MFQKELPFSALNFAPGPAQALYERWRRARPADPGAFCAALLGPLKYTLPAEVDEPTWRVALGHFARSRPSEGEFRRSLERRVARTGPTGSREAVGARVAAFLLRGWERYGVAGVLGATGATRSRSGSSAPVSTAAPHLRVAFRRFAQR